MIELLKEKAKMNKSLVKSKRWVVSFSDYADRPKQLNVNEVVESVAPSEPMAALPANFFDNQLEGVLATGVKQKEAEKQLKEWASLSLAHL